MAKSVRAVGQSLSVDPGSITACQIEKVEPSVTENYQRVRSTDRRIIEYDLVVARLANRHLCAVKTILRLLTGQKNAD